MSGRKGRCLLCLLQDLLRCIMDIRNLNFQMSRSIWRKFMDSRPYSQS